MSPTVHRRNGLLAADQRKWPTQHGHGGCGEVASALKGFQFFGNSRGRKHFIPKEDERTAWTNCD